MSRGYLLDTNTLIWWLYSAERLSFHAFDLLSEPAIDVYVSAVSAMEIATKYRIGKLPQAKPLVGRFAAVMAEEGFESLVLTIEHGDRAGSYPADHADPWDRLLAAQAEIEDLTLVTNDAKMEQFGVKPYW